MIKNRGRYDTINSETLAPKCSLFTLITTPQPTRLVFYVISNNYTSDYHPTIVHKTSILLIFLRMPETDNLKHPQQFYLTPATSPI